MSTGAWGEPAQGFGPAAFELGTDGPKVLVVGVDGSDSAMRAGAYALGMARRQGARVVCVHVRPIASSWPLTSGAAAAMEDTSEHIAQELAEELRRAAERVGLAEWEFRAERGDAFTELNRVADEVRADGVYVGASTQLQHRVAGSLALRLVREGRRPVTVVP